MTTQAERRTAEIALEPAWAPVVRWGGLCLFLSAALLIVFILIVFASGQELPLPAEDTLEDPALPVALFAVAAVGEFL
jgi:hypothetical protein